MPNALTSAKDSEIRLDWTRKRQFSRDTTSDHALQYHLVGVDKNERMREVAIVIDPSCMKKERGCCGFRCLVSNSRLSQTKHQVTSR
jgi:hypothetical protein